MGSITKRMRADGSASYRADHRIMKNGIFVEKQVRTFRTRAEAAQWLLLMSTADPHEVSSLINIRDSRKRLVREHPCETKAQEWNRVIKAAEEDPNSWLNLMFNGMVYRAKQNNRECSITREQFHSMMIRSGGVCEVTGVPFSREKTPKKSGPWTPSIDRIDSSLGYTMENSRVVVLAANLAMREWGDSVLIKMALSLSALKLKAMAA